MVLPIYIPPHGIEELDGSPMFTYGRGKGSGKRVMKVAWEDLALFLAAVLPDPFVTAGRVIVPPAESFPGQPWLFAQSVEVKPFKPDTVLGTNLFPAAYDWAECTINYATDEYDQYKADPHDDGPGGSDGSTGDAKVDTFVTHKVSFGGEFITWPTQSLQWEQAGDPSFDTARWAQGPPPAQLQVMGDTQAGVVTPTLEHSITWHYVYYPPWRQIRLCVGKVNAFNFAGAPAETLLFLGCEASREITSDGVRCWNMEYKFSEKNNNALNPSNPFGWNHFLRPDKQAGGSWQRIKKKIPAGATVVAPPAGTDWFFGQNKLPVADTRTFPQTAKPKFKIAVGLDILTVNKVTTNNGFGLLRTGQGPATSPLFFETDEATSQTYKQGTPVTQVYQTVISGAINSLSSVLPVDDLFGFPTDGRQYFISIDGEVMAVYGVTPKPTKKNSDAGLIVVVRGILGQIPVNHNKGAVVTIIPSSMYDLADFGGLFLSGLQTG